MGGVQKGAGDITAIVGAVEIVDANTSAVSTLTTSASSQELFAARPKRTDVAIRNDTDQLASIRRGSTAAVSGVEALELSSGQTLVITQWDGAIQVIFASVGTGTLYAEETYIV
jgi:hypothetical protein